MTDPVIQGVEPLLSREQVAAIYGVPESTIRAWSRDGTIPAGFFVGRHLRWYAEAIREDIAKRVKAANDAQREAVAG